MALNSIAIIQNNTLTENNLLFAAYNVVKNSTMQLINVTFIQNVLLRNLLNIVSSCRARLINNRMVGNSLERMFFVQSSYLGIDTIFIENNTFLKLFRVVECNVSRELIKIQENNVTFGYIWHDIR